MNRTHRRGWLRRGEAGQALVLWALCLTAIIGMAGLVLDGSNLQNNRRKLQNAADAAAFAGAYRLPGNPSAATTEDVQWLTANGSAGGEVTTNAVSTTSVTNDTITVSLRRTVGYSFMRVLGLSSGNVTATAKVQVGTVTSCVLSSNNCPAYAIWYQNVDGTPIFVSTSNPDVVIWRSVSWVSDSVKDPGGKNSQWEGKSSDFKGFFVNTSSVSSPCAATLECAGEVTTSGGNHCSDEYPYLQAANTAYANHTPFIVAVLNHETGNGSNTNVTIEGFAALNLNISQNAGKFPIDLQGKTCAFDLYGAIVGFSTTMAGFQQGGGTPPPSGDMCGTGVGLCTPKLIQ